MLLASFWEQYGLIIILVIFVGGVFLLEMFKKRRYQNMEDQLAKDLVEGATIKTYAGIYAEFVSVKNTADGKVATIKLKDGTLMDIDARSIYGTASLEEVVEPQVQTEIPEENPVIEATEPEKIEEQPAEPVVEETPAPEVEKKPRTRKPKENKVEK